MKILMFAHNGTLNRGCEAIVRSSSHILKDRLEKSYITLASGRPETDKIIPKIDRVVDASPRNLDITGVKKLRAYLELKLLKSEHYVLTETYKGINNKIKDSDVCLSIGGDNYCYGEQDWLYSIDKNIKKQGKKLVLWACSIGEEDLSEKKLVDLRTFDLILARESLTYNILRDKGLNNVRLVADPAFTMEQEELPLPSGWKKGDTIGLNFSPLVLKKNPEAKNSVRELIKHILKTTNSTIALTPHVIEEGNDDYALLSEFYQDFKRTKRVILLPNNLNAIQYKGYISRMRFFIGARTHATIAAYSTEVPTMVLGYSVKSRGIAKDLFGRERLVLGIKDISNKKKLIDEFNELVRDEKEIKKILKYKIPEIKAMSYKNADYLKELVV